MSTSYLNIEHWIVSQWGIDDLLWGKKWDSVYAERKRIKTQVQIRCFLGIIFIIHEMQSPSDNIHKLITPIM